MAQKIRKCVFPIAGTAVSSQRTLNMQDRMSEMRLIVDKSIIEFAVEEARAAGIEEFIFVTCAEKSGLEEQIEFVIDAAQESQLSPGEAVFIRQPKRLGIGNAIQHARYMIGDEPFAVLIPNLLVKSDSEGALSEMVSEWGIAGAEGIVPELLIGKAELQDSADIVRFGVIEHSPDGSLARVLEKPVAHETTSQSVAFGRWIASPALYGELDKASTGSGQFTDAVNGLLKKGMARSVPLSGKFYDLRKKQDFVKATVEYALDQPEVSEIVTHAHYNFMDRGVRTLRSEQLSRRYADLVPMALLTQVLESDFVDQAALVSSFGADSVVLLHMVSRINPDVPILFLETGMLFPETISYQKELSALLGLTDIRIIRPDPEESFIEDPDNLLYQGNSDACCNLRKTQPLRRALTEFDAWITGRKRFQSATRKFLPLFEEDIKGLIKVNPLANWEARDLKAYFARHDLPPHPLVAKGYPSIGCAPCTTKVAPGEDPRSGRWRGEEKVECGIHFVDGQIVRQ